MPPLSSVDPSKGIQAVTVSVSTIGQYGWSWCGSVSRPAGLLVERLVVPEPYGLDAEQLRRRLGDAGMEIERADVRRSPPRGSGTGRSSARSATSRRGPGVVRGCAGRRPRRRPTRTGPARLAGQELGHHDETVPPEILDQLTRASASRRPVSSHARVPSAVASSRPPGCSPTSSCARRRFEPRA